MLHFEVYILIVLKDSRLSKTMNRATTVCAAKCFIANINEFIGRLTLTRKAKLEQAKQRNNVWSEQGRGPGWTPPFITLPKGGTT